MHRTFVARAALAAGALILLAGCSSDKKSDNPAQTGGIKLVKAGQLTT